MAVTATVGSLALEDSTYGIIQDSLEPGEVTWRRELATSPYVVGGTEVGAVQDIARGSLTVRVRGSSAADLRTKVAALIDAFTASASYTLTVNVDGTAWAWTCMRADYNVRFDVPMRRSHFGRVTFTFPRSPVASSGPF